jgi:hypothetical protein
MADVIDVWNVRTFDPALLKVLKEHAEQIGSYFETELLIFLSYEHARGPNRPAMRPGNPHSDSYHALLDRMGEFMATRAIRAFHYTRLTDDEVTDLRRSGIQLSSKESLRQRLQALVRQRR